MTSRILGAAFLLQAVSSLISGTIVSGIIVSGKSGQSLINIANNRILIGADVLLEMATAIGVIFLGWVLFVALRKESEKSSIIAFGMYIVEGALVAVNSLAAYSLLSVAQKYITSGSSESLANGSSILQTMSFSLTLSLLPFGVGAIIFYFLLYKSRIGPRPLSLWGLLTAPLVLIGTVLGLLGHSVPNFIYYPYAPFEFVIGAWILIKGAKVKVATLLMRPTHLQGSSTTLEKASVPLEIGCP